MTPLPERFGLRLDRSVRSFRGGTVLVGGRPGRILTLGSAGRSTLDALLAGDGATPDGRVLARRLVTAGIAHPVPPRVDEDRLDQLVTVVVPVRDRPVQLARCLGALGRTSPVVVVDDGSQDPAAVAAVCDRFGAELVRRATSGGPGTARNTALPAVGTPLVAFVDSDCTVSERWLTSLVGHFDDPDLAAVAPRVRPYRRGRATRASWLDRYSASRSALDLGADEGEVGPDRSVRYVPSAALVVRRSALGEPFDERLPVGEDVDLVWRLVDAGRHVRYDPAVVVWHDEPSTWRALLARRFRYGTSAGPLARRHPDRLAPVELRPGPAVAAILALAGWPAVAAVAVAAQAGSLAAAVTGRGLPSWLPWRWSVEGTAWTVVGLAHAATTIGTPVLVLVALRSRRAARGSLLLAVIPAFVEWRRRRPPLDPTRWILASLADDLAYGAGVWVGCVRARSLRPLLPLLATAQHDGSVRD